MFDWRNEILEYLNTEEWKPLMSLALSCTNLEELKELKDEILLLKKKGNISLMQVTPEELLHYIINYYNEKGNSVDEERKDMWLTYAKNNIKDLKVFFNNSARLKGNKEK